MSCKGVNSEDYVRWSEHLLQRCFHSMNPPLAYLPHCLFAPDREALATIVKVVNAKVGILGDRPH